MIRRRISIVIVLLTGLTAGTAAAQEGRLGMPPIRPPNVVTFNERSPDSAFPKMCKRLGWEPRQHADYDLARESFRLRLPISYTGRQPYGLFVWISPGNQALVNPTWYPILDRNKLIFVGAENAGNERDPQARAGLAIDAVHNMKAKYNIDADRVFLSGLSGGGRMTSMVAVAFPDIFSGGYPIIGCNFYRDLPAADNPGQFWPRSFTLPSGKLETDVKRFRRFVLLTGETDINGPQMKACFEAYKKDGFQNVAFFEVPKMGHDMPNAEWFEKGLLALIEPVAGKKPTTQPATPPATDVKPTKPPTETKPPKVEEPADPAQAALRLAKLYVDNKMYPKAREKLQTVIDVYPDSPAAAEAKKLLKQIEGK